ncbi:hypothetical protein LSH36_457g04059 [Paralvinella palmiformis]|uniref:Uncharacterized protein n=1 Tax=Paralvinella palmiformis TaxID=53620 RepID=A0AAD9MYW2_9ANNE|nr:hypothetical protein LSH36_457g04059 [Paralvinella palmiformis]
MCYPSRASIIRSQDTGLILFLVDNWPIVANPGMLRIFPWPKGVFQAAILDLKRNKMNLVKPISTTITVVITKGHTSKRIAKNHQCFYLYTYSYSPMPRGKLWAVRTHHNNNKNSSKEECPSPMPKLFVIPKAFVQTPECDPRAPKPLWRASARTRTAPYAGSRRLAVEWTGRKDQGVQPANF